MTRTAWFVACEGMERLEDGRLTLHACSLSTFEVPGFPVTIDQILIRVFLRSPIGEPHGEFIARVEVPGYDPFAFKCPDVSGQLQGRADGDASYMITSIGVPLRDIRLDGSCRLKVFANIDGEDVYAGSLPVRQSPALLGRALGPDLLEILGRYRVARASNRQLAEDMAPHLLRAIDLFLAGAGLPADSGVEDGVNIQIGDGAYFHFAPSPIEAEAEVTIHGLPAGATATIEERHLFGLLFHVSPPDAPVTDIEIQVRSAE